ncbi:MAG: hypothetical protein AAF560_31195, partial [Acidobacteriota bacterium]
MYQRPAKPNQPWTLGLLCALPLLASTAGAQPQVFYSIDFQGPTIGMLDAVTATPITAGDLLMPAFGTPAKVVPAWVAPSAMTLQPEVDALSFGLDQPLAATGNPPFVYSTDEFAQGIFGAPGVPNVTSEGSTGNLEASADL